MKCPFRARRRLTIVGGTLLALLPWSPGLALDWADAYRQATARQDWTTAAESAIRWLEEEPENPEILARVASSRLREGDLEDADAWLTKWETLQPQPRADRLALKGELAWARNHPDEARQHWEKSFLQEATPAVGRRLMQASPWNPRSQYEETMRRVADAFQFAPALAVAAEAAVRARLWDQVKSDLAALNALGTQEAMKAAGPLESLMAARKTLATLDTAKKEGAAIALAQRAHFFSQHDAYQLAREDAEAALEQTPRLVLPRFTLAAFHRHRPQPESESELDRLRVVRWEGNGPVATLTWEPLLPWDQALSGTRAPLKAYLGRAEALLDSGQPYLALDDLQTSRPQSEKLPDFWILLGRVREDLGHFQAANEAFSTALEHQASPLPKPQLLAAREGLARLAMKRAEYTEAVRLYQWLSETDPDNASYSESLEAARKRQH